MICQHSKFFHPVKINIGMVGVFQAASTELWIHCLNWGHPFKICIAGVLTIYQSFFKALNYALCLFHSLKIIPVNDEPPKLQPGLKSKLECLEGDRVVITTEYLYATDSDSDDSRLTYIIVRSPIQGVIQKDGLAVDTFFQLDVTQGSISYIHTGNKQLPYLLTVFPRFLWNFLRIGSDDILVAIDVEWMGQAT